MVFLSIISFNVNVVQGAKFCEYIEQWVDMCLTCLGYLQKFDVCAILACVDARVKFRSDLRNSMLWSFFGVLAMVTSWLIFTFHYIERERERERDMVCVKKNPSRTNP